MAETKKPRKQHNLTAASSSSPTPGAAKPQNITRPTGNATGMRIGACVLWVVAIILEVLALLILVGKIPTNDTMRWVLGIGALVLDLICVIIGSQLWKKANHIDPASEANKVKFWLWNNLGVIASVLAFVPFIILMLTNKDADGKTKTIASVVAVIALLIGGVASYDFDPYSAEQQSQDLAAQIYDGVSVYWTAHGSVYHSHEDCYHLDRTDDLTYGSVAEAEAAKKERLCKTCAKRDEDEGLDLSGILTGESDDDVDADIDAEDVNDVDSIPDAA